MFDVSPGTLVVYGDIACPWSHLCVHGLRRARHRLGLDGQVDLDLHSFPLELFNGRGTPKRTLDAEIPVVAALHPSAGCEVGQRPDVANPGIDKHWEGEEGEGFPVIDCYDPSIYDDLIRRSAAR